jgi:hypothetical protein
LLAELLSFVNMLLVMLLLPLLLLLIFQLTVLCWLLPVLIRDVQLFQPAAR